MVKIKAVYFVIIRINITNNHGFASGHGQQSRCIVTTALIANGGFGAQNTAVSAHVIRKEKVITLYIRIDIFTWNGPFKNDRVERLRSIPTRPSMAGNNRGNSICICRPCQRYRISLEGKGIIADNSNTIVDI